MYIYLAIALLAAAMSGAGVWKVQAWRYDAKELQRVEAQREKERADRKVIDQAAVGHEKDKAQIRTEYLTITQEVERVVKEPFYVASEQCLDDAGLRSLNAAIGAERAASEPARAVSGPAPSRWWQPRRSPEVGR